MLDGLIMTMMLLNLFAMGSMSLLVPFYPGVAENKGISFKTIGLIISTYSITQVAFSFVVGKKLAQWGRRRFLYTGIFLTAVSIFGFGTVDWIEDPTTFVICSLIWRLISGLGGACMHVTTYAIVSLKYPENIEQNIGLLEAASGLGFFVGPLLGSAIFELTSYCVPFFVFSGLLVLSIGFFRKILSSDLDEDP